MFKKSILLVIIVLIFAASPLWAEISAEIVEAAEQGDASAQFNLGQIYRKGKGVAQNDAEAAKWYRKAAEQGHVKAQYNLGVSY
jgi:TPR repeat protein